MLVADDNAVVREELPKLLEIDGDIEIVGAASNGREAIAMAEVSSPDVIIMDVKMPELDGIAATKVIRTANPAVRVIMLSIFDTAEYVDASLEAGASNYMVKSTEVDTLANEIRRIANDQEIEAVECE